MKSNEFKLRSSFVKQKVLDRKETIKSVAVTIGMNDLSVYLSEIKIVLISRHNVEKLATYLNVKVEEIAERYTPQSSSFNKPNKRKESVEPPKEQAAIMQIDVDRKNEWIPLPTTLKPKTSFYAKDIFGEDKLLFRIENGNAVIYIDEYIPSEMIQTAIAYVKAWGRMLSENI